MNYPPLALLLLLAQAPQLPPNYPKGQYDESKVPKYTLPDPLALANGKRLKDARTWTQKRRPELLNLFATNVYGRTMAGRPKAMTWEVVAEDRQAREGKAVTKTVRLYFAGKKDGPSMEMNFTLPKTGQRVPVFLAPGFGRFNQLVFDRGYGLVICRIDQIQADNANGYAASIRAFFAPPGRKEPAPDEWGAIGAWAWGLSRAMDYLESDPDVDARRVSIMGVSRFGKVTMWAGAQDPRFAIVFSGESGCGGATIVRRQYGETVKSITGFAPFWFAGNFKTFADRVDNLPVDFHELIALMAPRPVYIATAEEDYWGDPRGSFVAARAAEPVYRIFGEKGLGVEEMPPVEVPVGDFIGYHNRKGKHGLNDYDWQQFLEFADRHFGRAGAALSTGRYRNLFVEAGHSPEEVSAKIRAGFEQLFHGDPATQTVYYPAGKNANGPLAYLTDIGHNDVRSEGMSYGMMIAVQLDKKAEFDALWNWAKTYMYRDAPGHPSRGFFAWSLKTDGTPNSEGPAPDGEEYFAMALYFAAGRWGNGAGIYNYRAEADRVLTAMRYRELITGPTVQGPRTAEAMFDPERVMVRFTPDGEGRYFTDPSYHLPGFYELWARWGPAADRPFWRKAAAVSRDFFQRTTNPVTALAPDYASFDGSPHPTRWNPQAEHFRVDAWRTAMNWSMDWAWWAADPRERQLSDKLQAFFESKGLDTYGQSYTLDGRQFAAEHSTGLVATNAVAGLAATHPRARQFAEALWKTPVPTGKWRYYDGMLYMLGLLHVSGEFRIWPPR